MTRRTNEHLIEAMAELDDTDIRAGLTAGQWHTKRAQGIARGFLDGTYDRKKVLAAKEKREKEEAEATKKALKESLNAHPAKAKTKVVANNEGAPRSEKERTVVVEQPKPTKTEKVAEGAPAVRKDEGKPLEKHTNPNVEQPKSNKSK